ncbi:MAG: amidohydrolase, partial [Gammaproteobacteria bacterium]|nr:amidohydrolase [Gammaproteobacteria bacterium]
MKKPWGYRLGKPNALGLIVVTFLVGSAGSVGADIDIIFVGDNIVTMDGSRPTAIAVEGEYIVRSGTRAQVSQWRTKATVVHELGSQALLPGFIDAHGHLSFTARTLDLANVASPPVGTVETIADLQDVLRRYIAKREIPPGQWVVGSGYDDSLIAQRRHPNRADLDVVSESHPILLTHVSGHLSAANSLALQQSAITAATADPQGGVIRRREDGSPNGVFEETAMQLLRRPASSADFAGQRALRLYASFGITTVQDGAASGAVVQALRDAANEGLLNLDVVIYAYIADAAPLPPELQFAAYDRRLKLGGIKMVLDGSPQGKTAYLTSPYAVPPPGQDEDYVGYPRHSQPVVDAMIRRYVNLGIPILAHANGDAAADMLIEAVGKTGTRSDHRTVMIHAQTVREDQLDRMAALGIIPSYFSAHTFFWGDWHRDSVLGIERAQRISPTRSTIDRNMTFTVHNDAPIV